jgi:uncharacterized membrane protein
MMSAISAGAGGERATRWLILGSLALNLFFVGAAGAYLVHQYGTTSTPTSPRLDRSVAGRIERIAATLPPADADILRATFRADTAQVETAQAALRREQDAVRGTLRAEPFNVAAMRAAMADTRAARQNFDLVLHDMVAVAASRMSVAGRNKLADWPGTRENAKAR